MFSQRELREFLLGASDPESESRIEDAILRGSIELESLQMAEEELIDEFLSGTLNPSETQQFRVHFLDNPERASRVEFAKTLIEYAKATHGDDGCTTPKPTLGSVHRQVSWRAVAMTMIAAVIVVSTILAIQRGELRRSIEVAQFYQGQVNSLQKQLAQGKVRQTGEKTIEAASPESRQTDSQERTALLELQPGSTRGIERENVLRVGSHSQSVLVNLEFMEPVSGTLREELVPVGTSAPPLWFQEFTIPLASPTMKSSILIPVSILASGDYQIFVKRREHNSSLTRLQNYSFRVIR